MNLTWEDARFAALDFETSGTLPEYALQPWRVKQGLSWITSMSAMAHDGTTLTRTHGGSYMPSKETIRDFLQQSIDNGWTIIGWNIAFDIQWMLALGLRDLVFQAKWLDGMLLWRHLFIEPEYDENRATKKSYGLKTAVAEFLPIYAGYEEGVDFHGAADPAVFEVLQKYNDRDTAFSWVVTKMIWEKLDERQLTAALIEAACIPMVAEANLTGMLVDTLVTKELDAHLHDTASAMLKKLEPDGVTEKVVRSPLQLSKLLFDDWKLPVLKENKSPKTGKISRSTDKEVLHELAFVDERCKDLRAYREALNNSAKFARAPLEAAEYNGDGYARPAAIIFGTYSGRLTYASKQGKNKDARQTGFALHQEKRGSMFRSIITAPPGYTLMEFDAAGQEFRWMAIMSGDPTMLNLCQPGEDAHSFMGSRIVGKDYRFLQEQSGVKDSQEEKDRYLGKVANLSLQYRTSAKKLRVVSRVQYLIPMELPEAQRIHSTYQRTYPGVPDYWKRQIELTKKLGYVETLAGRRVVVQGDWDGDWGWSMGSTAINYRIQGTGAEQKYLALKVLKDYLTKIGGFFAWDLHDGIYLYIPDAMVARAARDIKYLLDNLPYKAAWGFEPPIPMPWDCKSGKSWGSLKGWNFE